MKDSNLFSKLSPESRYLVAEHARTHEFDDTSIIIHKGQPVSGAYYVLEGQLRVFTYSARGDEATLYLLNPGDTCVLTLNCLFNNLRYPAWVESTPDTRVAMIPGRLYRQLFAQEAAVRDITVKALSSLVFRLMDELEDAKTCKLEQRLARFLLNHASDDGKVHMTQQVLAGHLGTTREVVARLMQGFNARGITATHRGVISILESKPLALLISAND